MNNQDLVRMIRAGIVANDDNQPPTSGWQLTIIKGTKQKGAN